MGSDPLWGGTGEEPGEPTEGKEKKFYPDYLFEVLLSMLVAVEAVIVLALLFPPEVGRRIDLLGRYQPRPEWYFLWLYQMIRYFPGWSAVLGTVILPAMVFLLLGAVPFLDGHRRGRRRRVLADAIMIVIGAGIFLLTVLSFL